jgi:hypothetical protein
MNVILTPGGEITIFAGDEEDVAISAAVAVIRMDDKNGVQYAITSCPIISRQLKHLTHRATQIVEHPREGPYDFWEDGMNWRLVF